MSKIGNYLLAKPMRANLAALVFVLMPFPIPGAAIAAIILGLMTLQRGASQGLVVLAWIALPAIAALLKWQLIAAHYELAFLACFVTWFLAVAFRRCRSCWARTAELAAVMGLVYVLLLYTLPATWLLYLESALEQTTIEALRQLVSLDVVSIKTLIHSKAFFLLGAFYSALCMVAISYLAIARIWQLRVVERTGQLVEFFGIQSCRMTGFLAVVLIASAIFWRLDALEAAAFIIAVPLFLGGLSLMLYVCFRLSQSKTMKLLLFLLLTLMVFFLPTVSFVMLVLIGFLDIWVNFRKLQWVPRSSISSGQASK